MSAPSTRTAATSVCWFRRDLRLGDNPALLDAAGAGAVVPLFVVDPVLWDPAGPPRRAYLLRSLRALDDSLGGRLVVRRGDPVDVVPTLAAEVQAGAVHVAADFGPYGRRRDTRVAQALSAREVPLVRTGSSYAVAPGRVRKGDGSAYQVFTPFYRAWRAHGWRAPAVAMKEIRYVEGLRSHPLPAGPDSEVPPLPQAGEAAALQRWTDFRDGGGLAAYAERRDRPEPGSTSELSVHLKFGEVHPRTLLADVAGVVGQGGPVGRVGRDSTDRSTGAETFRRELAWREFYADVLFTMPSSAREYLRPELGRLDYAGGARADAAFAAWAEGRTGYPFVDAGMRQLRAEGWMHNRLRMVVASFLVKDLHIEWPRGARFFLRWLRDGDLASNNHGWQWVAGSGTDAAPYVRVFNPVTQGLRFDPDGNYVRRYVAELRGVAGAAVHQPWALPGGLPAGYPERIVDHDVERRVSLERYGRLTAGTGQG